MTLIGTKSWRLGPGNTRRGDADPAQAAKGVRDDGKLLSKSKASLAESERMLARQITLLAELRTNGIVTTEAEKSVERLEAAVVAQRASFDDLVAKASAAASAPADSGLLTD